MNAQHLTFLLAALPMFAQGASAGDATADMEKIFSAANVRNTTALELALAGFSKKHHLTCTKSDRAEQLCTLADPAGANPGDNVQELSYSVTWPEAKPLAYKYVHIEITFNATYAPTFDELTHRYFKQWRDYGYLIDYPAPPAGCSIFLTRQNKSSRSKVSIQLVPPANGFSCKDRAVKLSATIQAGN